MAASDWYQCDQGLTIGQLGSEGGAILLDEEHPDGARITLEMGGAIAPFSITCGIYGWTFHTRFFGDRVEAETDFREMKDALTAIVALIISQGDVPDTLQLATGQIDSDDVRTKAMSVIGEAIGNFVERFP